MPPPLFRAAVLLLVLTAAGAFAQPDSTNGWGYPLDSLEADLVRWRAHPEMQVDSIGHSVQGRPIWRVTVGEEPGVVKPRIFVHARTHPAEVQSFYVLREMLWYVADTAAMTEAGIEAATLREDFVFHFVPAHNPDGVALGLARLNANGIDIEGNWNQSVLQPEVAALKTNFEELSTGPAEGQIRVALNLHSDQVNCSRFFFFHHENGTSAAYAELQREYIGRVRTYFEEGIEPWNYVVSWTNGFAPQYPESFWWRTRGPEVMALTYEDTNCPGAGDFYRTGRALALGSADYLRDNPPSRVARAEPERKAPDASRTVLQRNGRAGVIVRHPDGRMEYRDLQGRVLRVAP